MSLLLLHPLWLLALLPVAAGAVLAWRQRTAGGWEAVLSPAILGFVSRHGYLGPPERRWPVLLPFAIAALAALALSGPARLREDGIAFERLTRSSLPSTSRPRSPAAAGSPMRRPPPRRFCNRRGGGRSASSSTAPTPISPAPRPVTPRASRA